MMIKIADLFEITLSDNKKAIGHYVYWDDKNGPLIQVFNYLANKDEMRIEDAIKMPYMFPPVITGLKAAVRNGLWPVIGKKPVINFTYPKFISSHWNDKTGEVTNWFLYNGNSFISLGLALPEEYKNLEYLVVWSPFDVIYRIETGIIPFPYGEMIKNNRFAPIVQRKNIEG
jgi:hypothetical protein